MSLLEVRGLAVSFVQYEAGLRRRVLSPVTDVSLGVQPGQLVGVVGTSGAGKSLLAHAILDVLPPNALVTGHISYKGAELTRRRIQQLRGREIILLPQSVTFLNPRVRVGDQVARRAAIAGCPDPERRQSEALARFNLGPEAAALFPHQLSGGMARRVLLAMATVSEMQLLIADEPTPGLDPENAAGTFAEIRRLVDSGIGALAISHDVDLLCQVADQIVVIVDGVTVDQVTPAQLKRGDTQHEFSRKLWRSLPENWSEDVDGY